MTRRDPFVGFGNATNSSVKFQVVAEGGRVAEWSGGEPEINQLKVVNSGGRTITQIGEPEPYEIDLQLIFDTKAEYALLRAVQGVRATLRLLYGVTEDLDGTVQTLLGTRYLVLPDTMLMTVTNATRYPSGQRVAEATFQRSASIDSYIGFADTGEDE